MVAKLLEDSYGFERLGSFAAKKFTNVWRVDEMTVESELECRETAEDDVLVLDRYWGSTIESGWGRDKNL